MDQELFQGDRYIMHFQILANIVKIEIIEINPCQWRYTLLFRDMTCGGNVLGERYQVN